MWAQFKEEITPDLSELFTLRVDSEGSYQNYFQKVKTPLAFCTTNSDYQKLQAEWLTEHHWAPTRFHAFNGDHQGNIDTFWWKKFPLKPVKSENNFREESFAGCCQGDFLTWKSRENLVDSDDEYHGIVLIQLPRILSVSQRKWVRKIGAKLLGRAVYSYWLWAFKPVEEK